MAAKAAAKATTVGKIFCVVAKAEAKATARAGIFCNGKDGDAGKIFCCSNGCRNFLQRPRQWRWKKILGEKERKERGEGKRADSPLRQ